MVVEGDGMEIPKDIQKLLVAEAEEEVILHLVMMKMMIMMEEVVLAIAEMVEDHLLVMVDGSEIRKDMQKPLKEYGKFAVEEEVVLQEMMKMIMMIEEAVHHQWEGVVVVPAQDHPEEDGMEIPKDIQKPQRKAGKIVNNNREIEISISFFSF